VNGTNSLLSPPFTAHPFLLAAICSFRYHDIIVSGKESSVAQFIVRQLEEDVKVRLKRRAKRHGRSMEEEVRHILRNAVKEEGKLVPKLGSRIAVRFRKAGLTSDLPELHGQPARPADFEK
jgi:plasmid stability protein